MPESFVKLMRTQDAREIMTRPNEFILITHIAWRAKRTNGFSTHNLEVGEALVGDHKSYGLTERQYRTAKNNLKRWGLATFKGTNKGTVAKLTNSTIYDINGEVGDGLRANKRRTSDGQATTIKNDKKEKNICPTIFKIYVEEIKPLQKSKQRAEVNILKCLKRGHNSSDLISAIKNYSRVAKKNSPQYRKDPANFFGVKDKFYVDYLPENYIFEKKVIGPVN